VLLKVLRLDVPDARAFDRTQRRWSALDEIDGFLGQAGGWTNADPARAVIVAAWETRDAHGAFMNGEHDAIAGKQREIYAGAQTGLFETICEIPGEAGALNEAIAQSSYLRLADCTIRPERTQHFRNVQESVWNAGMARAPGMLGGAFGVSYDDVLRYAVATFWSDEAAHRHYQEQIFPGLSALAGLNDDVVRAAAYRVNLVADWCVPSDPNPPARS
jgi:heme-degrading monooxygenase HmoA